MENARKAQSAGTGLSDIGRHVGAAIGVCAGGAGLLLITGFFLPAFEFVTHVAPYLLAAALAGAFLTWILKAPRWALAAGFLGVLAPASLVAPEFAAAAVQGDRGFGAAPQLKIITVNLWTHNDNYAEFAQFIRRERPDIIIVQEAFGGWKTTIESLAPEYRVHAGCLDPSQCNVAILSRLALVESFAGTSTAIVGARLQFQTGAEEIAIDIVGVHLSRRQIFEARGPEWDELVDNAAQLGPAAILAGDFNATPWSASLQHLDRSIELRRRTRAFFSWPTSARSFSAAALRTPAPLFPIDHVYAGTRWRTIDMRRGPDLGSDHFPIIATFALESES
jgi:endonuclease/exonuclease/phosphatase (EEP) superfamily protein YafD